MRRFTVLCFLAALAAAPMLALSPTPASAFGGCGDYSMSRAGLGSGARAYGYRTLRRPYYRSRVYRARAIRPGVRRR
jgi:hypothetical protein